MKKLLWLLFIYFSCWNIAYAKNVKFIQVTDVHLTQDNAFCLRQFTDEVNKNYKDIDFVVFTGDNIDRPNMRDLETFLDIIKRINVRVYVLVGNHDLFKSQQMSKEIYMSKVRKILGAYHSDKANYVFKQNEIVFVVMDGVKEVIPGANGYFKHNELVWLDKILYKYSKRQVVILQHFPLLETHVSGHNLYNKDAYEQILRKHDNVISIISGHYHENREEKIENIYHIVTKNFADNSYFKVIEIDSDMIFTMLINNSVLYNKKYGKDYEECENFDSGR